jgi:hypothetical protein
LGGCIVDAEELAKLLGVLLLLLGGKLWLLLGGGGGVDGVVEVGVLLVLVLVLMLLVLLVLCWRGRTDWGDGVEWDCASVRLQYLGEKRRIMKGPGWCRGGGDAAPLAEP